ncbi:hypothetical protein C8R43DRAFT_961031 [Mycena crocata]|nr:hypothetical protein C8R43DRAFT_961031 [Mycena crocata]
MSFLLPPHDIRLMQGEFTSLKYLVAGFTDPREDTEQLMPLTIFHYAPKLKELIIVRGFNLQVFAFRWEISFLTIRGAQVHARACRDLMCSGESHVFKAESLYSADDQALGSLPDIPPLKHLVILELSRPHGQTDPTSQMQFLDRLTLPHLCYLQISEARFTPDPVDVIKNLVGLLPQAAIFR